MTRQSADAVRDTLARHGPATAPELAQRLGVHPATVERWCRDLQQRGRIRQVTGGQYALAESYPQTHVASD